MICDVRVAHKALLVVVLKNLLASFYAIHHRHVYVHYYKVELLRKGLLVSHQTVVSFNHIINVKFIQYAFDR